MFEKNVNVIAKINLQFYIHADWFQKDMVIQKSKRPSVPFIYVLS